MDCMRVFSKCELDIILQSRMLDTRCQTPAVHDNAPVNTGETEDV